MKTTTHSAVLLAYVFIIKCNRNFTQFGADETASIANGRGKIGMHSTKFIIKFHLLKCVYALIFVSKAKIKQLCYLFDSF